MTHRSKVFRRVNRIEASVCAEARTLSVADLYEAMGVPGRRALMSSRMRPLVQGTAVAGPAVTAHCTAGDNLMTHRALRLAQPGDVLVIVCDAEESAAQWGGLASRAALRLGLAGVVMQAAARDADDIRQLRFPVWSTVIHPSHPEKRGPGFVNVPVVCDGVLVHPGDLVVADGDGVLVIPRLAAAAALDGARERRAREGRMLEAIEAGGSLWDAAGIDAAWSRLDVDEEDGACDE